MAKPPATKPSWSVGNHAVYSDGVIVGFFRRFDSAHAWVRYLRTLNNVSRYTISVQGRIIYVNNPTEAGSLLP